ncbi:MAG: hypothetical protein OHK0029_38290 [Armatimonadaceae bacterium]
MLLDQSHRERSAELAIQLKTIRDEVIQEFGEEFFINPRILPLSKLIECLDELAQQGRSEKHLDAKKVIESATDLPAIKRDLHSGDNTEQEELVRRLHIAITEASAFLRACVKTCLMG